MDTVLSDSTKTNEMGSKLLAKAGSGLVLSQNGKLEETGRLHEALEGAIKGRLTSTQPAKSEAKTIIESIRNSSDDLVTFLQTRCFEPTQPVIPRQGSDGCRASF